MTATSTTGTGNGTANVPTTKDLNTSVNFLESTITSIVFGAGTDTTVTFDGVNTYGFSSLSNNVYTLTRDTFLANATISSGVTVYTAGYRLFCNGTLTNNGTIHNGGKNANGATAGGASTLGSLGIGTAGGRCSSNDFRRSSNRLISFP